MDSLTIHGRFAQRAMATPGAVAVSAGEVQLTYAGLNERANRLAHRLISLGAGAESPVAVLMERTVDRVAATLAILKTGSCYLPLHQAYPPDRMRWVMAEAGVKVLVADAARLDRDLPPTGAVSVIQGDGPLAGLPTADPGVGTDPGQLAYVIYTSGSTGPPKGVAVTHRDVLGLAGDQIFSGGQHDRVLLLAPHAFDVSTYELWVPLLRGGEVVLAPPGELDLGALPRLIEAGNVTAVHLTAGLFRLVAEVAPKSLAGVREVLTGGDVIAPTSIERVLDACPDLLIRAMYGVTEATVFSAHHAITAPYQAGTTVPIGAPLDGVHLYILDDHLDQVPRQIVGEIYLAGRLASGYFGQPDLTSASFVADPFGEPGGRMYRTGDLARWNDDGLAEFAGRADDQVKILGFRVEPAEVEAALASYPGLAHVTVVARSLSSGEKRLVGYVVMDSGELDSLALRAHAANSLPVYMVPAAFVQIAALPLTANGKLDRDALPEPDFENVSSYRAPANARQEALCAIFAEVLGVPKVGIDDSFFDLGGQSLFAMRLINRIKVELRADLPMDVLFDAPTVAGVDLALT